MRIEIPLYDGFDEVDAVAPYEALSNAARYGAGWEVALVGVDGPGAVVAAHGMVVHVEAGLGRPDAIVVPGGGWNDRDGPGAWTQVQDGAFPARLADLAPGCRWIASVCTGALILAAAGLLGGRPATTHPGAWTDLPAYGVEVITGARVVDDGTILTAGGVTSGLDLALWVIERTAGREIADQVAAEMVHERRGPIHTRDGEIGAAWRE